MESKKQQLIDLFWEYAAKMHKCKTDSERKEYEDLKTKIQYQLINEYRYDVIAGCRLIKNTELC